MNENRRYFTQLLKGDIPLSITFWIWFIFVSICINLFFEVSYVIEFSFNFFLYLVTLIYTVIIFVIVIRSANKYLGSKIFSFFAKLIVTINLFISLFQAIDIIKANFFEDLAINWEISSFQEQLPIKVNSYTLLQDIYKKDYEIVYKYQLLDKDLRINSNLNLKRFKSDVQNSLCDDEETIILLKKDYVLKYNYVDVNNDEIIKIITTKQSCGPSIYDLDILKEVLAQEKYIL